MLMEGAEQLKHDVAVYSTQTKADSRQLLLANVASCYLSSWLCFALCGLIFFSSLVLVGSTLVRLFSGVRFCPIVSVSMASVQLASPPSLNSLL
jgi:hypothetical protein